MCDSDSDEDQLSSDVDLGFLEKSPHWKMESWFFPSKIGYKPAWLALSEGIPCGKDLTCVICNKPYVFLCQLYAPILEKEECFHRTLYVFLCKSDGCSSCNSYKVFRNQLPRSNKYYPFDPPIEDEGWKPDLNPQFFVVKLCYLCGIRSTNHCGKCKLVYYCSKDHQILDWKYGHKEICKSGKQNTEIDKNKASFLFPEFEVIIEHESDIIAESEEVYGDEESNCLQNKGALEGIDCEEELSKMALSEEDKNFVKFRKQIKFAPDQVIRYDRKGKPLWVSDNNIPSVEKSVPNCQYCGGKRIFEFQILPQLLNYLELDVSQTSLDWGTLAIFTCENSCLIGPDYKEEYLLKQEMNADNPQS